MSHLSYPLRDETNKKNSETSDIPLSITDPRSNQPALPKLHISVGEPFRIYV